MYRLFAHSDLVASTVRAASTLRVYLTKWRCAVVLRQQAHQSKGCRLPDTPATHTAPGYRIPDRLRTQVILRDQTCAFPFCTTKARRCQLDHVIAAAGGRLTLKCQAANLGAQAFWRGVAAQAASGSVDELDQDDDRWNGMILRFRVA